MSKTLVYDEQWTTAEGTDMYVSDMTESHAKNCLRLMIMRSRQAADRKRMERLDKHMEGAQWRWCND